MSWDILLFSVYLSTYALATYACVRAIDRRAAPNGAIAWVLIIIALPLVGAILYFLFGEFRLKGYIRRHHKLTPKARLDHAAAFKPSIETPLTAFAGLYPARNGHVKLLVDGSETFRAIFSAIASAQHYILVQYYILRSDRLSLELQQLLIQKAKAGVSVYLLYDDMGSFGISRQYIHRLKEHGVHVASFLPITSLSKIFQANFRNHRKLVIVDSNLAFTGGLNVGEEYAARRSKSKNQVYWRDTHLEIHGPPVRALEQVFFEDWIFATGDTAVKRPAQVSQSVVRRTPENQTVQIVPTGPTDDAFTGVLLMLNLINSAKSRLWISSPYFVPDSAILRALELAAMRGVEVRLILPEKSDSRFVHWVSLTYAEDLQVMGVQTFLYHAGFVHQKVILVDDDCAAIGTMNFDNRAMYFNFETTVLILNKDFVAEVAQMLRKDLTYCKIHLSRPATISNMIRRFRDQTIRLLSPLL